MKKKTILLLYWSFGIYNLLFKFFSPAPWMDSFTDNISDAFVYFHLFLIYVLFFFSIVIAGDGRKFGFTKSKRQSLIPFLLFAGFLLSYFFLPLNSYYLQLEQGHLQSDRNKVIEWIKAQDIKLTEMPVSYALPENYAYLSMDGKISVIQDEYYFMVEFRYRATSDDYKSVIYVDQNYIKAPYQYFHPRSSGIRIVKYWFWYK